MIALIVGVAFPVLLLVAAAALVTLLLREGRRARRQEARAAERAARPSLPVRPTPFDPWPEPWLTWCCERGFLTRDAWHNRSCHHYDPSKENAR